MKRACCVVALIGLCLAAASAASDKDKPVLFEHYLNAAGSSEVPAKLAQYYETKTETACLQASTCCNGCFCSETCDSVGGLRYINGYGNCCENCSPLVWMVNFGCTECHADHYYGHEKEVTLDVQGQNSARCIFTDVPSALPMHVEDKPNVIVLGTFTGTCYMKDDKDACGHPDICGAHTTLNVQGVYYGVAQAVLEGSYYEPTQKDCILPYVISSLKETKKNAKAPEHPEHPEHPETPAHWWEHHGHNHPHGTSAAQRATRTPRSTSGGNNSGGNPTHTVGPAIVYMGQVEVSNRHGSSKYDDGYLQYSYFAPTDDLVWDYTGDVSAFPRLRQAGLLLQFADKEGREYKY